MILVFPGVPSLNDKETKVVKSICKSDFDNEIKRLQGLGWEVEEMSTRFRKALFGGVISYRADLRRGGK